MKRILFVLLIILPVYFSGSIYYLDKDYFVPPIKYNGIALIRSDSRGDGFFGAKRNGRHVHEGIDLFAEIDTPVFASRSGRVTEAGKGKGYGNYVVIRHTEDMATVYAHLFRIYAQKNKFVRQGQIIGTVGKSGNANHPAIQPHLHFEIRLAGIAQDPMLYLE